MKTLTKLTAALLVFCLSACGSSTESSSSSDNQPAAETAVSEPAETKSEKKSSKDKGTPFLEEQVLFDQEGLKITASYKEQSGDPAIQIRFDNSTGKNLRALPLDMYINNYACNNHEGCDIPADNSKGTLVIRQRNLPSGLTAYGLKLENAEQFSVRYRIFDEDAESSTVFLDTPELEIALNPLEPTGLIRYDEGLELYNEDGLRIVGRYMSTDKDSRVICFVENNGSQTLTVDTASFIVNDIKLDGDYAEIPSGRMALLNMLGMYMLEENNIESVEDIKIAFSFYDENDQLIKTTDLYSIPVE
ncbi:MAG: hypothetical protein E7190_10165 [Erysipelotrichaceae bacterium]|nr:hypothetical protein [Erysipelotrichaceae bacterium]